MSFQSKRSGTWRSSVPYGKASGSWKRAREGYVKNAGVWKQWWLDGGANDPTFNSFDTLRMANNVVNSLATKSNGQFVCGGSFTTFNSISATRIAQVNSDGTLDTTFTTNTGTGFSGDVNAIILQSDGKIICGGAFTTFNGTTVNNIARLNSDGTRDTAFTMTGTGIGGTVNDAAIQSDGKIVAVGSFSFYDGIAVYNIVRLNSDGTHDTAFTTNTGASFNGVVYAVAIQSDGKILCGGTFTTFNGATVNRIVRLNSDGTRDTAFTTNTGTAFSDLVDDMAIQSDGKILCVGGFATFNGATVNRIVRLNSDGTHDTAFTTNTGTAFNASTVSAIALQSDGKIVCVGGFVTFQGNIVNRIVRLDADGRYDAAFTANTGTGVSLTPAAVAIQSNDRILCAGGLSSFNGKVISNIVRLTEDGAFVQDSFEIYGANGDIRALAAQSDGKIVIAGSFTMYNGVTANRISRANSDGRPDVTFSTNVQAGFSTTVEAVALQSDGKIVVAGTFTTFNGITVNRIARLNSDGSLDTAFATNTGTGFSGTVNGIAVQSDGKIVCVGAFATFNGATVTRIARLNSDGTRDTAFTTNTGTGFASTATTVAIQSDGKILCGGLFTTFNGATVNRIVRLNSDGTRDTAFTTNTGTAFNTSSVEVVALQSNGKIVCVGLFTAFNGTTTNRIARLNSDGTLDTAFNTNAGTGFNFGVTKMIIQSNDKIVCSGGFTAFNDTTAAGRIARLNSDGTLDTTFTTNVGTGFSANPSSLIASPDGKILAGGLFNTFDNKVRSFIARIGGD